MSQNFSPFYGQVIFHCVDILRFVYPFMVDGHLGCFQFLAVMSNVAMNVRIRFLMRTHVFIFLGHMLRSGVARSYG